MPVYTKRKDYLVNEPKVKLVEDAVDGNIKSEQYIPRLPAHSQQEYARYLERATYYNVPAKVVEALLGSLLRKPYVCEGVHNNTINSDFGSFEEFLQECYENIITEGYIGVLVDFDESKRLPKLVTYSGSQIINWSHDFVVIEEVYLQPKDSDPFELEEIQVYRELRLVDGVYTVNIWTPTSQKDSVGQKSYAIFDSYTPTIRGATLDFIPFCFVNVFNNEAEVKPPHILNLCEIAIQHYRVDCEESLAVHYTAVPQAWVSGRFASDGSARTVGAERTEPIQRSLKLGAGDVWHLEENASVGYLEVSGAGLTALRLKRLDLAEQLMTLGARLLYTKRGVESADALAMRNGSEAAALLSLATSLENALKWLLGVYNKWAGVNTEPTIVLNKDFTAQKMSAQEITAYLNLFKEGVISLEDLVKNLITMDAILDVNNTAKLNNNQENISNGQ